MQTTRILLLSLGPLLLSTSVNGALNGHIQARLVITSACQISSEQPGAPPAGAGGVLDFGQQGPVWNDTLRANLDEPGGSNLQVSCNPQVRAFTVTINGGANPDGTTRRLSNGGVLIPYQLSTDPAGRSNYGIGQQLNFSVSSAAQIPIPIYGVVTANPKALPAGIYRDTLTVTLDW
ncbi:MULTISPECIES: spore coat U domain-containing protein [Pseudomonas]|jgi:spore coat protein U-like protein|uniref:Csu type fimbrial protein n=1 Tax=Pseudomonas TaxID=286 RepID=UPI000BA48F7E|nr:MULTISPECIES: spore coat U domain-containing protein [Pseudomonas]MCU1724362.1 spore coat U domain-containing protein [Pseudomonas sp. 5P_5.1_Bac1]MCU1734641.1 spore coat U domain-containing protein [Pseudomonas sp. 20P_3.2_Bac4]MCU1743034.1 spore coat U domain-containing protein [Pseudomonas sp. 20P_3.2_Bac5]